MRTHVLDAFARDWVSRWRAAGGLADADPTSNGVGYVLTADAIQQARKRHLIGMLHGTVGAQAALARILSEESAPVPAGRISA